MDAWPHHQPVGVEGRSVGERQAAQIVFEALLTWQRQQRLGSSSR